jgi:hypothetical protein
VNILKKYKVYVSIALVVSLIVIFWPTAGQTSSGRVEDIRIAKAQYPVGEIFGKNDLNQTFVSNLDNLAEIQVLFATWARKNTGSVFVKISEVGGEEFFSETLDMATMADNSFISFKFEPRKDSKDRKYLINISSPESTPANNVTCWGMLENVPKDFELTYGGQKSNLVIVFNTFTA